MFDLYLVAYPWDLPVEDLGGALDRLYGEVGVTGLSLWVGAPPATQLRAIPRTPRVFRTRGGLFFQPAERHYTPTRCLPIVSSWVTTGSPLAYISKGCASRDLKLRAIVSASATGLMAERYPEIACRNTFGDESYTRLCLANPAVQTYLRAIAQDLSANDSVSAITLADFEIRWADVDDLQAGVPLGPLERSLLAVCFCESCRQRSESAGIDVEAARRTVEQAVKKAFEHGPCKGVRIEGFLTEHAGLAEHRRRQAEELNSLLRKLKEACRCDLLLERCADDSPEGAATELDLSIPSAVITCVEDDSEFPKVMPRGARRNELRLGAMSAIGPAGARLVRTLPEAAEAGWTAVEIDHYGLLSEPALTTLKQAVRFARRSAVG